MTIVVGKKIAEEIAAQVTDLVAKLKETPRLLVISCAPNFETTTYLEMKERIATSMGVCLVKKIFPKTATTEDILTYIAAETDLYTGVLVQLPLPSHIATDLILAAVPTGKDVDAFSYGKEETPVLPPVVAAIEVIAERYALTWEGKRVVIFGAGRLVGAPARAYAERKGAQVVVCDQDTEDVTTHTLAADIIVLGAGKPNLLTKDMVKEGVVVFDAGASEDDGVLVGDAAPDVALKASLFTPVPGGIGPITVAILFRNLLTLASRQ
jgi:methylenetetrahydrofolate dehydrogenase (NADP+) / methenyltetrahydrofolate cyclohydrolase